jgi:hypothetical protein
VIELLAALALAPWAHPLAFRPLTGWGTGASGNVPSRYGPSSSRRPQESTAWMARGVLYRDGATEDPPNTTLAHLPSAAVLVWAAIFQGVQSREQKPISLDLDRAQHFPCCEGEFVAGGMYELHGFGPRRAYTVYVRIYFGSRPTVASRAEAARALSRLALPAPRV